MTKIKFTGATAIASNHEALTVGAVGMQVQFEFNSAWDGLHKIAVFNCGGVTKDVLDSSFPANICPIPWECLQEEGETLYCGVYGTDSNGKVIIPSKMARLGTVHPGADPTGDESVDPTLPVWQQAINIAQEALSKLTGKVNRNGDTMTGDLDIGFHTLRFGSTTGMTLENIDIIRLVAYREEDGVFLRNVEIPYEDTDAANKKYVDDVGIAALDYADYIFSLLNKSVVFEVPVKASQADKTVPYSGTLSWEALTEAINTRKEVTVYALAILGEDRVTDICLLKPIEVSFASSEIYKIVLATQYGNFADDSLVYRELTCTAGGIKYHTAIV